MKGPEQTKTGSQARPALVAIDLGAESCRVSLLRWVNDQPKAELVFRFANGPIQQNGSLYWDLPHICDSVEYGLRACAAIANDGIAAIAVDGWAVDYVRLDSAGKARGNPFCYRDQRTLSAQKKVHARISPERLYELTGIQILPLNTLYQLCADRADADKQKSPWLTLPEYLLYHLGGKRVSEYTNATHTQLLGVDGRKWCSEIFAAGALDLEAAPPLVPPGTDIGQLQGPLASLPAFASTRLIAPACHDTASAIAGIPVAEDDDDWAFISSGTWSLVGRVLDAPCITAAAREANFSNEGGVGGKINFLKNVNGMWVLQQCMEDWRTQGGGWTLDSLIQEASSLTRPEVLIDLDDPELLLPGKMLERINRQFARRKQPAIPCETLRAPEVANLIFHSLAVRYAAVLADLARITGRPIRCVYIVGGGSKNALLNRLTENASGLPVFVGPQESATIGNFAVQLASLSGAYSSECGVSAAVVAKKARVLTGHVGQHRQSKNEVEVSKC
jgi:rhamnulokinase